VDKISIDLTPQEYNLVMKQLSMGQLAECIDLFMKLRQIGVDAQSGTKSVPPPNK
jgi:hypothetical protein